MAKKVGIKVAQNTWYLMFHFWNPKIRDNFGTEPVLGLVLWYKHTLFWCISKIHRPKFFILMSLHSSRVMFIKQIQIETRNKDGIVRAATTSSSYIHTYTVAISPSWEWHKRPKKVSISTLKSQKKGQGTFIFFLSILFPIVGAYTIQ